MFIGDDVFVVIGIVDQAPRDPGVLGALLIPHSVAETRFGVAGPQRVLVETELGATRLIAEQAATALDPINPQNLTVLAPVDTTGLHKGVEDDFNGLFILLGLISLAVGAVGVANVTLVTVMERTGEIGLRRAPGARHRHTAGQILCESAATGLVGGIIGASAGIIVIVAVSARRDWTPLLDPWLRFAAQPVGMFLGLIAGLYPSIRAARLEPTEALRTGLSRQLNDPRDLSCMVASTRS